MKTYNTVSENLEVVLKLTFIPLIATGIITLVYAIIVGDVDTSLMASALIPSDRIKEIIKAYVQPKNLLTKGDTNTKISKNHGVTFNLSLAPFNMNSKGVNLCNGASKGCVSACIFDTGLATVYQTIKKSRIFKSEFYVRNKSAFIKRLVKEVQNKIKNNSDKEVFFRLNTFSDLDFLAMMKHRENFDFNTVPGNVYFYDYSAILGKAIKYFDNEKYTVAFSRKEDNESDVEVALQLGICVAIVFGGNTLPKYYKGVKVVDGDKTDIEMIKYRKGVVLGLRAKGKEGKKDKTGFVVQPDTARKYDVKKYTFINTEKQHIRLGLAR